MGFYAGARLVGSPNLYDRSAVRSVHLQAVGLTGEIEYSRFPYYALFLKPLGWLPYYKAYAVWTVAMAVAFAGFVALWPGIDATERWLICCWSLPPFVCLFNGQDDLLLLLWTALTARLLRAGKPLAAGMVLALCASKYNLFILVPVVILAQRRWRMAAGTAFGGGVLLALSFAAAGKNWPQSYYAVLADERISTGVEHMPNLHSLFGMGPYGLPLQIAAGLAIAAGLFVASRCASDFEGPFALALVSGVLVGFHGYLADAALFLPALMIFFTAAYARLPAMILIAPIPWVVLQLPKPLPALTQLLIVAFAGAGLVSISTQRLSADKGAS